LLLVFLVRLLGRLSANAFASVLARLDALLGHGAAVQEAVAVVAGFQDERAGKKSAGRTARKEA
jgi:hypothetical protein